MGDIVLISESMVERAAIAVADYMYGDAWKLDFYRGDVRKFGNTVEVDFVEIAKAALEAALCDLTGKTKSPHKGAS